MGSPFSSMTKGFVPRLRHVPARCLHKVYRRPRFRTFLQEIELGARASFPYGVHPISVLYLRLVWVIKDTRKERKIVPFRRLAGPFDCLHPSPVFIHPLLFRPANEAHSINTGLTYGVLARTTSTTHY